MDRTLFAELVEMGNALVSYTRKHSHVVAAKGRPVFDTDGNPCLEVLTYVPIDYLHGTTFLGLTGVRQSIPATTTPSNQTAPDVQLIHYNRVPISDPEEQYGIGCDYWRTLPTNHPNTWLAADNPDHVVPLHTPDANKVTCPHCLKDMAQVAEWDAEERRTGTYYV